MSNLIGRGAGLFGFLAAALLVTQPASAALIIDTGIPGQSDLKSSVRNVESGPDWLPLWRAGKFELTDSYSMTGFSTWTTVARQGLVRWVIYSDSGNFPGDLGTPLWSMESLSPAPTSEPFWAGVEGFTFELAAGTYWLALEIPIGEPTWLLRPIGNPPNDPNAPDTLPPNPLLAEAGTFGSVWPNVFWSASGSRFGYRIYGELVDGPPVVPEPASLALLGLGLAGLGLSRRRKA